jgi:hypothetical protein
MNVLVETQETKGNNSNLADHQLGQWNYGNEVMRYSGHVLFPATAIAKCAVSLSVGNKEQDCHSEDIKAHNGFMAMSNPSPSCWMSLDHAMWLLILVSSEYHVRDGNKQAVSDLVKDPNPRL